MTALLALMMSLMLTACSVTPPMTSVRAAPSPARLPEEEETEEARCVVETEVREDTALAEDGTVVASYRFVLPVMRVERKDGAVVEMAEDEAEVRALELQEAFNLRFAQWAAAREFQGMAEEARETLEWQRQEGIPWQGGYTLELDCEIYQTDSLISILGTYYSNTGGAHPNTWQLSWNFDLLQGIFLDPEYLSESKDLTDAVTEEIIRQANQPDENGQIPAENYWEDYASIAANWSSYAVSFDGEGMTVIFSPYELAPYAAGPQSFRFSYDWLSPHLSDYGRVLLGLETLESEE